MRALIELIIIVLAVALVWNQSLQSQVARFFPAVAMVSNSEAPPVDAKPTANPVRHPALSPLVPGELTVIQSVQVPVTIAGRAAGTLTIPSGTRVKLISVTGENLQIRHANNNYVIPASFTDFDPRTKVVLQSQNPNLPSPHPASTPVVTQVQARQSGADWMHAPTSMDKPHKANK